MNAPLWGAGVGATAVAISRGSVERGREERRSRRRSKRTVEGEGDWRRTTIRMTSRPKAKEVPGPRTEQTREVEEEQASQANKKDVLQRASREEVEVEERANEAGWVIRGCCVFSSTFFPRFQCRSDVFPFCRISLLVKRCPLSHR